MRRPALRKIEHVSPTLIGTLEVCFLRVAYQLDAEFHHLQKERPAALLGQLVHDVMTDKKVRDRESFDTAWRVGEVAALDVLKRTWGPAEVPVPRRWPYYQRTKEASWISVRDRLKRGEGRKTRAGKVVREARVEAKDGSLRGFIDFALVLEDGATFISDFKSGKILENGVLRPSVRRQLLLYAYLWHEVHDVWPKALRVVSLREGTLNVEFTAALAREEAEKSRRMMNSYNASLSAVKDAFELASPSCVNCLHCDYRVACGPYLDSIDDSWEQHRPAFLGSVAGSHTEGSRHILTVQVSKSTRRTEKDDVTLSWPLGQRVASVGDVVCALDIRPVGLDDSYEAKWDSQVEILASLGAQDHD